MKAGQFLSGSTLPIPQKMFFLVIILNLIIAYTSMECSSISQH